MFEEYISENFEKKTFIRDVHGSGKITSCNLYLFSQYFGYKLENLRAEKYNFFTKFRLFKLFFELIDIFHFCQMCLEVEN